MWNRTSVSNQKSVLPKIWIFKANLKLESNLTAKPQIVKNQISNWISDTNSITTRLSIGRYIEIKFYEVIVASLLRIEMLSDNCLIVSTSFTIHVNVTWDRLRKSTFEYHEVYRNFWLNRLSFQSNDQSAESISLNRDLIDSRFDFAHHRDLLPSMHWMQCTKCWY